MALASFTADDHLERTSMYTTQSVNHTWRLRSGHVVMGTDSREMWTVVDDTAQALYCGGGYCAPLLDPTLCSPEASPAAEHCDTTLARDLAPLGLGPRHWGPDAFLNLFTAPDYAPDGHLAVRAVGRASVERVALHAWRDQLVAVLACAHGPSPARGPAARLTVHDREVAP